MVKKLKGKATTELKGNEKRKREKEWEQAAAFWMKVLPVILGLLVLLSVYFVFWIKEQQADINS